MLKNLKINYFVFFFKNVLKNRNKVLYYKTLEKILYFTKMTLYSLKSVIFLYIFLISIYLYPHETLTKSCNLSLKLQLICQHFQLILKRIRNIYLFHNTHTPPKQ